MNKLIYSNINAINNEKQLINEALPVMQSVYDAFQKYDVTITLEQIQLLQHTVNQSDAKALNDRINTIITNALLEVAGSQTFNGVPINREKLRDLISVPDISPLIEAVSQFDKFLSYRTIVNTVFLRLEDGVISKLPDFDQLITKHHSSYTKTVKGDALLEKLTSLQTAVQEWSDFAKEHRYVDSYTSIGEIAGLKMVGYGKYEIDVQFVSAKDF